jgi:hypothetical protein
MKKLLAVVVMLSGLAMLAATAKAAGTANLTITVTPTGLTKSIAIVSGTPYDFGSLPVAVSSVSATAVVVRNDGTGPMTVGFDVTTEGAPWSVGGTAGDDVYRLQALFNTARPADGDFDNAGTNDDLTTALQQSTGAKFAGDQTGVSVSPKAANRDRNLWLRLDMPTTSSDDVQHTIVVELSAN